MATVLAPPVVPDIDDRPQRLIQLSNGLICLLICDMKSLISAAAMTVGCGQMDDPPEVQGLAHFTEHMVFLGSDKYPDEDEFDRFCATHNGHSNAYTAMHNTTFYFELSCGGLQGSLDRFSGFFECPTFKESCSDREMKAVDSENSNNLQNVWSREYQLTRTTGTPGHPWSMFGTGNYETLHDIPEQTGVSITQHLHAFHKQHYSATNMRLCVVGSNELDQLQDWVVTFFSGIPNRPLHAHVPSAVPFAGEDWFQLYRVVPVDSTPKLNFHWSTPANITEWRNKPYRLLSFCLGHEGPGSLLALLKSRGWACDLQAGFTQSLRDFAIFVCNITLTTEGINHWREIIHLLHRYLQIMSTAEQSVCAALFAESILIEDASFKFQEKQSGETIVQSASTGMLEYPPEFCHCAPTCILEKDFRFDHWQRWLSFLLDPAKNMRVHFVATKEAHEEDAKCELEWLSERWYGTEYRTEPLHAALASDHSSPSPVSFSALADLGAAADADNELHLPPSNPYLPANFSMLPLESTSDPQPVVTLERAVAWAATEVALKEPRVSFCMHLQVPWADANAESYITNSLMVKVIEETFSTSKYLAEEAKYEITLTHQHSSCVTSGLRLSILGFSDKIDAVVRDVCATIAAPLLSPELFAYVTGTMQQTLDELKVSDAYSFCLRPGDHVRRRPWNSESAKEEALKGVTLQKLSDAHARFMRECFATIIMCGNLSLAAAADLSTLALEALEIPIVPIAAGSAVPAFTQAPHVALQLPPLLRVETVLWSQEEANIGVMLEYDLGIQDDNKEAVANVVDKLFGRHVFQTLRTQMQLGYIAQGWYSKHFKIGYQRVLVQSSLHPPAHVVEHVLAAADMFSKVLDETPEADVAETARAFANKMREPEQSVYVKSERIADEVFDRTFRFSRRLEMADVFERVTKADAVAFVNEFLVSAGPRTRRMLCVAQGLAHAQSSEFPALAASQPGDSVVVDGSSQLPLQQWIESQTSCTFWPNQYPS